MGVVGRLLKALSTGDRHAPYVVLVILLNFRIGESSMEAIDALSIHKDICRHLQQALPTYCTACSCLIPIGLNGPSNQRRRAGEVPIALVSIGSTWIAPADPSLSEDDPRHVKAAFVVTAFRSDQAKMSALVTMWEIVQRHDGVRVLGASITKHPAGDQLALINVGKLGTMIAAVQAGHEEIADWIEANPNEDIVPLTKEQHADLSDRGVVFIEVAVH
jgi:hypothetical protein